MSILDKVKYAMGMTSTPLSMSELNGIQKELNDVKNIMTDNITTSGTFPTLTPRPGSVIYTNGIPYNKITWTKYGELQESQQAKDEAELVNTKKFKMLAEKFCSLNPNWSVVPDINEPLRKIRIMHNSNQLWIQDCFPSNEIRVVGGSIQKTRYKETDPLNQIGLEFPVHSMYIFEKWAFGLEDCPYGK
jgi:hypothetical protein